MALNDTVFNSCRWLEKNHEQTPIFTLMFENLQNDTPFSLLFPLGPSISFCSSGQVFFPLWLCLVRAQALHDVILFLLNELYLNTFLLLRWQGMHIMFLHTKEKCYKLLKDYLTCMLLLYTINYIHKCLDSQVPLVMLSLVVRDYTSHATPWKLNILSQMCPQDIT